MSGSDDLHRVTPRISDEDVERLLAGSAGAIDESEGLADVSGVLQALRLSADSTELAGLSTALGAYAAAVVTDAKQPDAARALIKLLTGPTADGVLKARGMERPPA